VRSEQFAFGLGLVAQLRREVEQQASRTTRQLLHRLNLPAGTDVTRLLTEIGELRKQVRQLSQQLDAHEQAPPPRSVKAAAPTRKESTRGRARS
jgi:hypothetical protein